MVNETSAAFPSCDGVTSTGSPSPATSRPSPLSRSIAACVSGRSASVTTTWSVRSVPCGHFSLRSLIPATPSIDSGKRGDVRVARPQVERRRRERAAARPPTRSSSTPAGPSPRSRARPQKPLPSWTAARRSSQASADRPQPRMGAIGTAAAMRGSHAAGRPRLTRSPRIASVAGRNVRLPMTDTNTTDDRADRHRREQRHAERDQPGQRDHHRQPREEHGAAGRAAGDLDRARIARARRVARPGSG